MNESSGNTPNRKFTGNGEGNSSSLSALRENGSNISRARDNGRPSSENLFRSGAQSTSDIVDRRPSTPSNPRPISGGSGSSNDDLNRQMRKQNDVANQNRNALHKNAQNAANQSLKQKVASGAMQAAGVPKPVADMAAKVAAAKKRQQGPLGKMVDRINDGGSASGFPDDNPAETSSVDEDGNHKSLRERDQEDEARNRQSGDVSFFIKRTTLLKLAFVSMGSGFLTFMLIILLSVVADNKGASIVMGEMASDDKDLVTETRKEMGDAVFEDALGLGTEDAYGQGAIDKNVYEEYKNRFALIGNVFSSENVCEGDECLTRDEFKYYLKMADVALRYKNKYHVTLDWILLSATLNYSNMTEEEMMKANYNEYEEDDVEDYDKLMDLDWDYDYKKIPGYNYLSPNDFRYDMQILAKNMVKKTTTQKCTKTETDKEGNTVVTVVASRTDEDVEDQYLQKGQPYYLECPAGTEYSINSNYKLDKDKYDDFLLEYLEHKFYLQMENELPVDPGNTDMTPAPAGGEYISPLPNWESRCRSSFYGYRIHPITGKPNNHSGDDYPAAAGTPVYAVKDGTVIETRYDSSMGNFVRLDHGNGIISVYMHASKVFVKKGDEVKQGQVIMAVGTTGSSTGNHLHITFYKNGKLDNPANYIGAQRAC